MNTLLYIIELLEKIEYNNEYSSDIEDNDRIAEEIEQIIGENMYFDIFKTTYSFLSQASQNTDQLNLTLKIIQSQFEEIHDLIVEFCPQIAISTFYDLEYFRKRLARRGYVLNKYIAKSASNEPTNEFLNHHKKNLTKIKVQLEDQRTFSYIGENPYYAYDFLLKKLIEKNKIDETTKVVFRKAFNNSKIGDIKKKINWRGTVPELKLLIKVMVECNKISKATNPSQLISALFTIRGDNVSAEQLNSNSGAASPNYNTFLNELMARC